MKDLVSNWGSFTEKMDAAVCPVFCQLDGQCNPCKAYITLDARDRTIVADYEVNNGYSMDEHNNKVVKLQIPPCSLGGSIVQYCEENKELIKRYFEEYEENWDGNNYVGTISEELQEKFNWMDESNEAMEDIEVGNVLSAKEYLSEFGINIKENEEGVEFLEITYISKNTYLDKDSTDKEIKNVADYLYYEKDDSTEIYGDVETTLEEMIEDLA